MEIICCQKITIQSKQVSQLNLLMAFTVLHFYMLEILFVNVIYVSVHELNTDRIFPSWTFLISTVISYCDNNCRPP